MNDTRDSGSTRSANTGDAQQPLDHRDFRVFPRQADADVDGQHARGLRFVRGQHRAIEAAGEQDERGHAAMIDAT